VPTVTTTDVLDDHALSEVLRPRVDLIEERRVDDETFDLVDGPFDRYRRTVTTRALGDGRHEVTQTTDYRLAIPLWGWMFAPLVRRALADPPPPGTTPWWLPPDRLDRRATETLSYLCAFAAIAGYLGVLLSQTNTYFKEEFEASTQAVSWVLIGVRLAGLAALAITAQADRRGRRTILVWSTYLGIGLAATGAVAPGIVWIGVSQTTARSFSAAIALVVAIMAAEEMPAGARAFAVSVLTMTGALGAGGVVVFLWVADLAPWAWRLFFLTPLLMVVPVWRISRRIPETRRFEAHEVAEVDRPELLAHEGLPRSEHRRRFAMLAATALLFSVFWTPASGFFNDYFRTERGFSGGEIALLQVLTNLPGGAAIVIGGRLADQRGRRVVGAVGVLGGVGFTVAMYQATGWSVWLFSTLATLIGGIAVPALGVYGPELFPTGTRGKTNGLLNVAGVLGAVGGLLMVGVLRDRWGSYSDAITVMAVGPALVAVIVLAFYPETAHRELEDLNPEDVPAPHTAAELHRLDDAFEHLHPHDPVADDHAGDARPGSRTPPDR
jgi:MFS family permease